VLEVDVGPLGPEAAPQILTGDHLSRMLEECRQELEGLLLNLDEAAVPAKRLRLEVRFKRTEADKRRSRAR
jgi:hypothetical protein